MTMRYISVQLDVVTADDRASYQTRFSAGLNVIEAPNSWGKSTLVQSLVYGLGLEGSFSTSHLSPLGEAMTSSIELNGHRQAVVESSVTLVIQNENGTFLRTKRWAQSLDHQRHLIQTWEANAEAGLDDAEQVDRYVREAGSAVRELGFHYKLAEFIGWDLPQVPSFNGGESPLYLEVLFPMFYVEQKYGWSGLSPRIPTNFQIQSAYRRAAEFVLGLESLDRTKRIERGRQTVARIKDALRDHETRLELDMAKNGWQLTEKVRPATVDAGLLGQEEVAALFETVSDSGERTSVQMRLQELSKNLAELSETAITNAGPRTAQAQSELRIAEQSVTRLSTRIKQYQELHEATVAERESLSERLTELNSDRDRLIDIAKLERLGSDLALTSLTAAHCPTCAQNLDSAHVATGIVLDLAANTKLVASERGTVESLLAAADVRVAAVRGRIDLEQLSLREIRQSIRALRDELVGPTNSPSVSQVRARLVLENQISTMQAAFENAIQLAEELARLLADAAVAEANLRVLRQEGPDSEDATTVRLFSREFRQSLRAFGFSSLPVDELSISESTLLPEHGGFELTLTFDINHGLSASDTIRAKWAYYAALSRVCSMRAQAHPLGTLIMDEPRQQEAALGSVAALYQELAEIGNDQQVIVASSANRIDLQASLEGLSVNRIMSDQDHVLAAPAQVI